MYFVSDLMSTHLVTLAPSDNLGLADAIFQNARVRHLPVTDNGKLVGLLTQRDLLRALQDGRVARERRAEEVMIKEVVTVTPDTALRHAVKRMLHRKLGCLPIVDAEGALVGILTEADLAKFAANIDTELNEIEHAAERVAGSSLPGDE